MSIFDLRGNSSKAMSWNYSNPNNPGYSLQLGGTVVEISNPQKINYATKQPEFWPDGNPKRNLRVTVLDSTGQEWGWTFAPKSAAAKACLDALDPTGRRPVNITELLGKLVNISTKDGIYNQQHPREWAVEVIGEGQANMVRGLVDLAEAPAQKAAGPQPAPAPAPAGSVQAAVQQAFGVTGVYDQNLPF